MTVRGAERFDTEWLLTMRHVADRLNVSYRTVERLVASGQLPCKRVGTLVRIHPADFRAYIERDKEAAPAPSVTRLPQSGRRTPRGSAQPSFLDELAAVER